MLNEATTIKIQGANFDTVTELKFFEPAEKNAEHKKKLKGKEVVKGVLLFGRNGSGKSTTARAFRKIAGENVHTILNAVLCDKDGQPITLTEDEKKQIFVFDEDYVENNVKLQQDHLHTIVMLGEAADLSDQIARATAEAKAAEDAFQSQKAKYDEYNDPGDSKCPKYHLMRITKALREDRENDNWAGRDRKIYGRKKNTAVTDETYKQFLNIVPSKSKFSLETDFNELFAVLEAAKTGTSIIEASVPKVADCCKNVDYLALQQLLAVEIEKPELSEREKKLFALVEARQSANLAQRLQLLQRSETVECPYCYQPLSPAYKQSLAASIEKVLSRTVEEHQAALRGYQFQTIEIDLSPFQSLEGYTLCKESLGQANAAIQEIRESVQKKIDNPYASIHLDGYAVQATVLKLDAALEELERTRITYNRAATDIRPIQEELTRINNEIARRDIDDDVPQYHAQLKAYAAVKNELDKLQCEWDKKKSVVAELEAQRKNVRLAVDAINACLQYIFFAKDRLRIEYVDGEYRLLSRGKNVKPCDISVGERNIIGLSYFFTSILDGQDEKTAYNKEYLLVIDDPVSSYDFENKVGILSFLKYKLSEFLLGNQDTKALVMTHDLTTFYDMQKVLDEIKPANCEYSPETKRLELQDRKLKGFNVNNRSEYTELLKSVYNYASGLCEQNALAIGNMMRQVLESFSTFEYKKGIVDISTDEKILALLPEPEYRTYYRNLMYRLVLHGGSHREEQIKAMRDYRFFELISEEEKQRTAQEVLCFIYLLNPLHLLKHLCNGNEDKKAEKKLNAWCQDIKARTMVI